jgi:formylglycine-generating enzyme required for sulfatase activity
MAVKPRIVREKKQVRGYIEELGGGSTLEMIWIPGGTFQMGTSDEEIDALCKEYSTEWFKKERPQHGVTVPMFFMGRYPITEAQWRAVAQLPPAGKELDRAPSDNGAEHPVVNVSWQDAIEFCARLTRETGRNYRLPSEAEWEYACRAGTTTPFYFGETISTELANYDGNYAYGRGEKGLYREGTTEVTEFEAANDFGLSDMHGNVWEWCLDPWHKDYEGAPDNGSVWDEKNKADNHYQNILTNINALIKDNRSHVLRGGSWDFTPWYCRSAYRTSLDASFDYCGFRVVCAPQDS